MRIKFFSGCDNKYFLMACTLAESFERYCPEFSLKICDFGMSASQAECFRSRGLLLELPNELTGASQPAWLFKASLFRFLENDQCDAIGWIDSDAFLASRIYEDCQDLILPALNQGRDTMAICKGRVGNSWEISPEAAEFHSMDLTYPYYNSGFWITNAFATLGDWAAQIADVPRVGMWEQDLLNYLLYKNDVEILELDNEVWNVTFDALDGMSRDSTGQLNFQGKEPKVIHINSAFEKQTASVGELQGFIRSLNNQQLRQDQRELLDCALTKMGLNVAGSPVKYRSSISTILRKTSRQLRRKLRQKLGGG